VLHDKSEALSGALYHVTGTLFLASGWRYHQTTIPHSHTSTRSTYKYHLA
jgi:hypothetical protein